MANSLTFELLSLNTEFRQRVKILLLEVAYDVMAEVDVTNIGLARKSYATAILGNPTNFIDRTSQGLSVQAGIYQNMHEVTDDTLAADQAVDPTLVVGDLMYTGSKSDGAWADATDLTIKEQIELIYNYLAGIYPTS